MPHILELNTVNKKYGSTWALRETSLKTEKGELLTILGPSGSGKSTLLNLVSGVIKPTSGSIFLYSKDITQLPIHKRNIGVVFQGYSLFPHLSTFKNIEFPLRMAVHRKPRSEINNLVSNIIEMVGLNGLENRKPRQLSGGQQQRVALARALVFSPEMLLLDEPLGALDRSLRDQMQNEIRDLQQKLNITVLYVTHDQTEAMSISDRIAVMQDGKIEQISTPSDIYNNPKNRFVAGFVGESNFLNGKVIKVDENCIYIELNNNTIIKCFFKNRIDIGSEITIVVRPENIKLSSNGNLNKNNVEGIIRKKTFLGDIYRLTIQIGEKTNWIVNIYDSLEKLNYNNNDSVNLNWKIEDTNIVNY